MTRKTATWMPMYWGDYLRDTAHLDTLEHGAYLLLIAHYWISGKAIPDDDKRLAIITRLNTEKWAEIRPVICELFTVKRAKWFHKRVEVELETAETISHARSQAGKVGAAARWQTHSKRIATASKTHPKRMANGWQNDAPSPTHRRVEETNADALAKKGANHGQRPGARCPADLEITEQDREYAQSRGVDGDELWPGYIAHFTNGQGRNKTSSNWHGGNSHWGTWCRNEAKWAAERRRDRPKSTGIVAGALEDIAALKGKV